MGLTVPRQSLGTSSTTEKVGRIFLWFVRTSIGTLVQFFVRRRSGMPQVRRVSIRRITAVDITDLLRDSPSGEADLRANNTVEKTSD